MTPHDPPNQDEKQQRIAELHQAIARMERQIRDLEESQHGQPLATRLVALRTARPRKSADEIRQAKESKRNAG